MRRTSPRQPLICALTVAASLVALLAPPADARRTPVYNDPPTYHGPKHSPGTKPPKPPPKGPVVQLSSAGTFPDVLVDEAGTSHIVWNEGRGDDSDATRYCRLPRGATHCDGDPATLTWDKGYGSGDSPQFNTDNLGPKVVRVGDQLVILSQRYPTGASRPDGSQGSSNVIAWTSQDGGRNWNGPAIVARHNLGDLVVVGPDEDPTIVNFGVDPLCDAPGPSGMCVQAIKSGQYAKDDHNFSTDSDENYNPTMALGPDGFPVLAVTDLSGRILVRRWKGGGDVADPGNWSTSPKFAGMESELAGGPAGTYLLERPSFGKPLEVRKLATRADGTATPEGASAVSGARAQFGELAEDPAGRLLATWQDGAKGVQLRTALPPSAGKKPKFAAAQTLIPGAGNGQLAIDATADGGGFVALNHTGGVNAEGVIEAVGYGPQTKTGKPGIADLPGGGRASSSTTCQKVKFGSFSVDASQGCFLNGKGKNRNVVVTGGEVNVDGVRIVPDDGTKLVIDPVKLRLDTTGGAARVIVSAPGVGDVVLWHGELHRDLSGVRPGASLFEFPAGDFNPDVFGFPIPGNIPVRLERDGVHIPVDLELPKAFGGFSGHAELIADKQRGLHIDSLHIHIGPVPLGALVIDHIDLDYAGASDTWDGDGAVTVLPGGQLQAHATFVMGDFKGASIFFTPNPAIVIGPFVYLLKIGGEFMTDPVHIGASALIGAGAAVNGTSPVNVDGKFEMTFPANGPAEFKMSGSVNVFMFGIGDGFLRFFTDGYADFGGHTGLSFGPLSVDANMAGFVDAPTGKFGANLDGTVKLCLKIGPFRPCAGAGADVALSNAGFAACARLKLPDPPAGPGDLTGGIEYPWADFDPSVLVSPLLATKSLLEHARIPCSTSKFKVVPPRARVARAGGGVSVSVAGGLPSETLLVEGDGGTPNVTVTGPGGASFSSDAPGAAGYVASLEGVDAAYVVLTKPAAGDWTVTPNDGSVAVKRVQQSTGYVPATVKAHLGGKGRKRTVAYRVANGGNGQRIEFVEKGAFGTHVLGRASGAHGTLRFKPADAKGGKRTVTAMVQHDGMVTDRKRVGTYVAPGPVRPHAVRRLRAKRARTTVTVSWRGVAGAGRYAIKLRGSHGTQVGRLVSSRTHTVKFKHVRIDERELVQVRAVSRLGRIGSARTARLKPGRRR